MPSALTVEAFRLTGFRTDLFKSLLRLVKDVIIFKSLRPKYALEKLTQVRVVRLIVEA